MQRLVPGSVWLVGAGPGDPAHLTVRATQALTQADIILHDTLAGRAVLAHARRGAEIVAVGKRKAAPTLPQARINALLVAHARAGKRVVRLKGGDPFVFGRGGEEAMALAEAGIPFEIVPGVSAGIAAPALAGIPVTHRGLSSAVTFLTGHDESGSVPEGLDWEAIARGAPTLVAFMAVSTLDTIAVRLIAGGRDPATPVAVIARASLPDQSVVTTTLGACTLDVRRAGIASPALVVIGPVVALAAVLAASASVPARAVAR
ncbi:uroporphyrinogen-III C-methyltransferase [Elioraea rosea]|uniref:uroporphyrinogen-III C-methyltransferase n=1 Tax=Elioraea rosea TaxID=2492390 RepID=UPI001182CDF4|nr:uroporphyrinogen-III C-methyltransferase [Elioraea rosea]